jgi:SPP1 family predicted phage head-tail adaptor
VLSEAGATAPGRLRLRLALDKATRSPDGLGGATVTWSEIATLFAEASPLRAEEQPRGEGLADLVLHRIVIRHRGDVAPGDRFRLGARTFLILAVSDPQEDGRYLVCLAEEGRT